MNSNANFQLDNRTIQDKLQYLYEYSSQVPFREVGPAEIAFTDVSDEYSAPYEKERATDGVKGTWWHSKNSTDILPFIEFTLTKPSLLKSLEITRKPSQGIHIHGTVIQLKDVDGKVVWTETIILSPATADHQIIDGVPAAPEAFRFEIPNHLTSVKTVRLERGPRASEDETTGNYLALSEIKIEKYNSWCDVLFKSLSVSELADKYQKPKGSLPPHQALLFAFLKMLETPQALMNGLPARQRDLYYQGLLGLRPREAKPGKVAVSMQLEEKASNTMIPKGSVLKAGQDEKGIDIEYQLDHDVLANQSSFSALYVSDSPCEEIHAPETDCLFDEHSTDESEQNWSLNGVPLDHRYLFLGIKDLNENDTLSLYWELTSASEHKIEWSYLDAQNRWQSLDATLLDNTNGLSQSGTWSTLWPEASGEEGSGPIEGVFSTYRKWIRGRFTSPRLVAADASSYHHVYYTQNAIDESLSSFWHCAIPGAATYTGDEYLEVMFDEPTNLSDLTIYFRQVDAWAARHIDGTVVELFDVQNTLIKEEVIVDPENSREKSVTFEWQEEQKGVTKIRLSKPSDITDRQIAVAGFGVGQSLIGVKPIILKGLITNTTTATVANAGQLTDFVNQEPLPPESITALATDIQGISEIVQPWQSWGGRKEETHSQYNSRVAQLLSHRNRAISCADIMSLAKSHFTYLFDIISHPNRDSLEFIVVPRAESDEAGSNLRPLLGQKKLKDISVYLNTRTSEWCDIDVHNPRYITVKLNCHIIFEAGINHEYAKSKLSESLIQHYMPWVKNLELGPKVANKFEYFDVLTFIQQHQYVKAINMLALDNIQESRVAVNNEVLVFDINKIYINEDIEG